MDKVIRSELIDVRGTTRLIIGDPMYLEHPKGVENMIFTGMIQSSPLGKLKIEEIQHKEDNLTFTTIEVAVYQAGKKEILDNYLKNRYYPYFIRKQINLGTDSAGFYLETKEYGENFDTGADGMYGYLMVGKRGYGMMLRFSLDASMCPYEEIKRTMLTLFPKA